MNIVELLNDKSLKGTEKRTQLISLIMDNTVNLSEIEAVNSSLTLKQIAIILEAIEEITNKKMKQLDSDYIKFAERYIESKDNSCKREASRIIGNMAEQYPDKLDSAIKLLIQNTHNESTVVRWGSAYALSRIIVLSQFSNTDLFHTINEICEKEQESGVRNQYVKALKKVLKGRK